MLYKEGKRCSAAAGAGTGKTTTIIGRILYYTLGKVNRLLADLANGGPGVVAGAVTPQTPAIPRTALPFLAECFLQQRTGTCARSQMLLLSGLHGSSSGGCCLQGISPRHILALTFTNKAAKELKDRLAARGVRDVRVSTFHALCNTVLSEFYVEAGFTKRPLIWSSPAELRAVLAEAMRCAPTASQPPVCLVKPSTLQCLKASSPAILQDASLPCPS